MSGQRGFSLVELLMSAALTLLVMGTLFSMIGPMHRAFAAEPERADVRQRLRVAADVLARDLAAAAGYAESGVPEDPPIAPYLRAGSSPDPAGTYRPSAISVTLRGEPGTSAPLVYTYYLAPPGADNVPRLRRARLGGADVPVVDHLVALRFEYFGGPPGPAAPIDPARLVDGPWHPHGAAANRYDLDLLGVRTVRVALRVEASRMSLRGGPGGLFVRVGTGHGTHLVPDAQVQFDVTVRAWSPR